MKKNEYWTVKFLKNGFFVRKGDYSTGLFKRKKDCVSHCYNEIKEGFVQVVKVHIEEVKK